MKITNENLANKANQKAAVGGRQRVQTNPPNSGGHYEKENDRRAAKRQHLEEGSEYGQILPTAEVIMKKKMTGGVAKSKQHLRKAASTDRSSQQRRSL